MNKNITFALLITLFNTGCTVQTQAKTPDMISEEESPCLDAMKASAGAVYTTAKEAVQRSSEDGLIKDASDKLDELKDRAGEAFDTFMED